MKPTGGWRIDRVSLFFLFLFSLSKNRAITQTTLEPHESQRGRENDAEESCKRYRRLDFVVYGVRRELTRERALCALFAPSLLVIIPEARNLRSAWRWALDDVHLRRSPGEICFSGAVSDFEYLSLDRHECKFIESRAPLSRIWRRASISTAELAKFSIVT